MVEFVEVFKQAHRMCNEMGCSCRKCPASDDEGFCLIKPWAYDVNPGEAERRVMAWAKEHPEPKYPTWQEWLEEQRVISNGGWFTKGYEPIPADIAEKLGLNPKEAKDDDK